MADEVLRDPAGVVTSTIGELAARCRTSLPSVTRFCLALGLSGYAELRLALAAEGARTTGWERSTGTEIGADDGPEDIVSTLLNAVMQALRDTVAELDVGALRTAAIAIADARRVDLYAVSGSAAMAED